MSVLHLFQTLVYQILKSSILTETYIDYVNSHLLFQLINLFITQYLDIDQNIDLAREFS